MRDQGWGGVTGPGFLAMLYPCLASLAGFVEIASSGLGGG